MKRIFIVFTFIFISLLSFSDNTNTGITIMPLDEQKVELDFNVKLLLGMIKTENNPKYKKLLDYIDENLDKKGEVRYSTKINFKKVSIEYFSESSFINLIVLSNSGPYSYLSFTITVSY